VVFIVCRPLTVLICASCEVSCELSSGLSGSWLFICVTSIVRNWFCRSAALALPFCSAWFTAEVVLLPTLEVVVMVGSG